MLYVPATSWCAMASNKPLPLAVVSIIRYPGKHDSASQESLLSLFGPPSLLANDKYFKKFTLPKIRGGGRRVRPAPPWIRYWFLNIYIHWLPVSQRVVFRTALVVWKCVHGFAPCRLSQPGTYSQPTFIGGLFPIPPLFSFPFSSPSILPLSSRPLPSLPVPLEV